MAQAYPRRYERLKKLDYMGRVKGEKNFFVVYDNYNATTTKHIC